MRGNWIGGVAATLLCLVVTGCGAGDATSEEPVPTLSVRPSPSASASTESGFTVSADPSDSATASPGEQGSETSAPSDTAAPEPSDDPGTVDLGTAPTSYEGAAAYVAKARTDGGQQQMRVFRTPEDIYCVMSSEYLRPACELPQGAGVEDARTCRNTMGDRVGRVEITANRARAVCNTDTIRERVPETVAPVGVVTHQGSGLACAVADIGVTCVHEGREVGFFLGLDSYAVLG